MNNNDANTPKDDYTELCKNAYNEGYNARKNGKSKRTNYHAWITQPWIEWNRGWNDCDDALDTRAVMDE